jgi:hypothetical protein
MVLLYHITLTIAIDISLVLTIILEVESRSRGAETQEGKGAEEPFEMLREASLWDRTGGGAEEQRGKGVPRPRFAEHPCGEAEAQRLASFSIPRGRF